MESGGTTGARGAGGGALIGKRTWSVSDKRRKRGEIEG